MQASRRLLLALVATTLSTSALAQTWPSKPIRVLVPFPPGGGTDIIAREVTQAVTTNTKWTFVIDNKPGAGGNLGVDQTAKSPPDGYTIVLGQTSNLAINPTLYSKLPYDRSRTWCRSDWSRARRSFWSCRPPRLTRRLLTSWPLRRPSRAR